MVKQTIHIIFQVGWKGDVNLSHSVTPPSNGITTMSANFGERSFTINGEPTAYIISTNSWR